MFSHVRALPTVAAEAASGRILRHNPLGRRLVAKIQHRADATSSGDPAEPQGACTGTVAHAVGSHSALGKGRFHRGEHD